MINSIVMAVAGLLFLAVTLGFWAFILLFHVLADWRASEMGRHVMSFMAVCATILTYSWANFAFDFPDWFNSVTRIGMYGALAWVVWRRVRILIKTQRENRASVVETLNGRPDTETTQPIP